MSPELVIRRMTTDDLTAVMHIQQACYEPAFHEPLAAFSAKLQASTDTCWVACQGTRAQAYLVSLPLRGASAPALHATFCPPGEQANWLYVHDLAIGPQVRGTGLAHRLINTAVAHAAAQGLPEIGLIAVQGSQAFWARHGFTPCLSSANMPAEKLATFGADAIYMTRQLRISTP